MNSVFNEFGRDICDLCFMLLRDSTHVTKVWCWSADGLLGGRKLFTIRKKLYFIRLYFTKFRTFCFPPNSQMDEVYFTRIQLKYS